MTKEYTNGEVTIVWKPKVCIHSEKCWRGLSSVFDPKSKPWINADGATTDQIINQVSKCPSGALSTYMNDEGAEGASATESERASAEATRLELVPNGPVILKGKCEIALSDGTTKTVEGNTALCRCGASSNKPFCDGTHSKISFEAE